MTYKSVDQLQKFLAEEVFSYTQDAKKASGRALGTLVEIITFYLFKAWGFENSLAIERPLAEYGNPEITHNVEYSLHPFLNLAAVKLSTPLPLSSQKILKELKDKNYPLNNYLRVDNTLLTTSKILRNSCVIANRNQPYLSYLMANLDSIEDNSFNITILEQLAKPYAMIECKRVGVEEGTRKGPQTIEKAKQGAYVAKAVSSLQKTRLSSGELRGLIYKSGNKIYTKSYKDLVDEIVNSDERDLIKDFILTIGVVSNHGNWFTSENHNKELKVLAQSYDWLLFLTDEGLTEFITEFLIEPNKILLPAKNAFLASYSAEKKKNAFTKVQMDYEADQVLQSFFKNKLGYISKWFNIITPRDVNIDNLHIQITKLKNKHWEKIHIK